jgi:porin
MVLPMLKAITVSICAAFLLGATLHGAKSEDDGTSARAKFSAAITPSPDFESLRIKGLNIPLPGPQDTIDPDFKGIRSGLASLGIGYIGYTNNNFFYNTLQGERTTFGRQAYNGQKPSKSRMSYS